MSISYDPAILSISSTLGSGDLLVGANLVNSAFSGTVNVQPGSVAISQLSADGTKLLPFGTSGTLLKLRATVLSTTPGTTPINIRTGSSIYDASATAEELVLIPAPTNADNDAVDGLLTIVSRPTFATDSYSFSLPENSSTGTSVGIAVATNPNPATPLAYSLTGTGAANFAIDAAGSITVAAGAVLNFEGTNQFTLQATASDGVNSATATISISLTNVNEAPVLSAASYVFSLPENSPAGQAVGSVLANDPDAGTSLVYSLSGTGASNFVINPSTGAITVAAGATLNFEGSNVFNLVASATDGTLVTQAPVTISLTNVNEAPTFTSGTNASYSIFNKAPANTVIGSVAASDVDAGQTVVYSIVGGDPTRLFAISSSGVITKATAAALAATPYALTIRASDGTLSTTTTVTITTKSVNTPPTILVDGVAKTSVSLKEFATGSATAIGTLVATLSASDIDEPNTVFNLTMVDPSGAFNFEASTGRLTVKDTSKLDFETAKPFTLTFTTADNGIPGAPKPVNATLRLTVTLEDANDAPTIAFKASKANPAVGANVGVTVLDTRTVAPFASLTIGDADKVKTSPDSLSVSITLDPAKGEFTSDSLTRTGVVKDAEVAGRYTFTGTAAAATAALTKLIFKPTENRVAVGSPETTQFTLSVSDNIASAVVDTSTTVISTSVNNVPLVTGALANQVLLSDKSTNLPFSGVTITDPDVTNTVGTSNGAGQPLTVTVVIDVAAKGGFTSASLTDSGFAAVEATPGTYRFIGTATAATTAIRKLVFQPAENRVKPLKTEVTKFTINVEDGVVTRPTSNKVTSVVTTSTNDAATINGVAGSVIPGIDDKSTAKPFTAFSLGDVDPTAKVTVTVTLSNAANGTLIGKFKLSSPGVYTFTGTPVQATTELQNLVFRPTANQVAPGSTATTTFAISVIDEFSTVATVNAGPSLTVTSANDAPTITGTKAGLAVNDNATGIPFSKVAIVDPDNQNVTVTITLSNSANGVFTAESLTASGFAASTTAGVYTYTGKATDATLAIRKLVFKPTTNQAPTKGATITTTFAINVNDGQLQATDAVTTVIAKRVA